MTNRNEPWELFSGSGHSVGAGGVCQECGYADLARWQDGKTLMGREEAHGEGEAIQV